jgi:putative sigma-54 modulation protein
MKVIVLLNIGHASGLWLLVSLRDKYTCMKIIIETPDFKANRKLNSFIKEKVEKLNHFSERIAEGKVLLKHEKSDTHENKICEIKLSVPGNNLFASKQCESFEEAILLTVDALKQQIIKRKERP